MSVLVYTESPGGKLKKSSLEAIYYGSQVAKIMGSEAVALVLGTASDINELATYGADKVVHIDDTSLNQFDDTQYASVIHQVAENLGASTIILSHSAKGKSLVGRLAVKFEAGAVTGVNSLPEVSGGFSVSKMVFSGKAAVTYKVVKGRQVLTLAGNTMQIEPVNAAGTPVSVNVNIPASRTQVVSVDTIDGEVPLPEAELVVSAGRGMKGPENWGIIEDLAAALGATTACSRPVADSGWRPHHEHVGQTGVAIKPNLYIAAGISGAIQHLAGVNRSKVIVVINKDPEAPFFKAADYGIVGDLFDVVPQLTEAVKRWKASH